MVRRSRWAAVAALAGLITLSVAGMWTLVPAAGREHRLTPIVVGAKTFTEQYVLAELLTLALKHAEIPVTSKTSLGSTILFEALTAGGVDCYVDYSGTLWTNAMKRRDIPSRSVLLDEMTRWLAEKRGVMLLGPLGFENTYALAITGQTSQKYKIHSLQELSSRAPELRIGSDYEFFSRPEWLALSASYHLRFAEQRTFDPSLMYAAVKTGSVDVISAYSTDGRIAADKLVVLDDPHGALPPYDAILLLSPRAAERRDMVAALTPLVGSVSNELMREANRAVDLEHRPVAEAAALLWKANSKNH